MIQHGEILCFMPLQKYFFIVCAINTVNLVCDQKTHNNWIA